MTAYKILNMLRVEGFNVTSTDNGGLKISPSSSLPSDLRELIRVNKAEISKLLDDSKASTSSLIAAAMKVCDHYSDTDTARSDMRLDCINTPQHMQSDLLEHFKQTYGKKP
jgi:hypothetical protein